MEQEEVYFSQFHDIKPGWIYDSNNRKMINIDAASSEKTSVTVDSTLVRNNVLMKLAFNKEILHEYVWQKKFLNSKEKNCFLILVDSSYSENLNCLNSYIKGTVTKVNYKRSICILVCSDDETSHGACSSYIKNVITGAEAKMDDRTCDSCKKCFIYDENGASISKERSFDSVIHCLREVSRIIDEMKNWENFYVWSWKFVKQNSCKEVMASVNKPSSEETPFFKTKAFETTDANCQSPGSSPAQHSFGDDAYTQKPSQLTINDELTEDKKVCVHKSTLYVGLRSDISNLERPVFNTSFESVHRTIVTDCTPESDKSAKDGFTDPAHEKATANKAHDVTSCSLTSILSHRTSDLTESNMVTTNSSLTWSAKEFIDDKDTQNKALQYSNGTTDSSVDIVDKHITASDVKKNDSQSKNLPNDKLICEITDDYNIDEHCEKQTKTNSIKRTSIAKNLPSDGLPMSETDASDQRQIKKLKKENFIEYRGKKIIHTVIEKNGIRKVEIGTKANEEKGKVIVLLGATGSGKTSIVNLCANFYFGAHNANDEKLFVVDSKLKSDRVTVYTFYPEGETQHSLTVVDTPGLNDSTGAEIHDHVDALKSFLALACSQGMEINALCFVAQAHLVRLTSSEKLVMDYVKSLFGSEVEKHIMALVTFSDNQPTPPVIEAMGQYGFESPFFVKFNNTLLISKTETVDELDKIYWRTGFRSWKKCLKHLSVIGPLSNVAISSVKNEVFNKSVLNKYSSCLEGEIHSFITMCRKKKKVEEFYSDKELLCARKKVWMASNDAYNVEEKIQDNTKEMFLINYCQRQLNNETIPLRLAVIKLFLLLDEESTLRCVVMNLVSTLLKCLGIFNGHSKSRGNSLITFCIACDKKCCFEKQYCDSYQNVVKLKCKCTHSNGLHGPPTEVSNLTSFRYFGKQQLYSHTARSIKKEISKYDCLNCEVDDLWTVGQVLKCLQLSKPAEFQRHDINTIFVSLIKLAEQV